MTTIRDVARQAGVSIASVSRVVNGREGVGIEITERVRQAVSELGFQPNSVASSLKTARTHKAWALRSPSVFGRRCPNSASSRTA